MSFSVVCLMFLLNLCSAQGPCRNNEFLCDDGSCINRAWKCDGEADCTDGSDEADTICRSFCPYGNFTCGNGSCISALYVCDGNNDCGDQTDEDEKACPHLHNDGNATKESPVTCRSDEFLCDDGICIHGEWRCDGEADCLDESDEALKLCRPETCRSDQFACYNNGSCIDLNWKCDGEYDCIDGSDETDELCGTEGCLINQFKCDNGTCIKESYRCDGHNDCEDMSDENENYCSVLNSNPSDKDPFAKFADLCGYLGGSSPDMRMGSEDVLPLAHGIVGGEEAKKTYPWMVLLGKKEEIGYHWFCGGALITDRHVLTAAHCFRTISKPDVVRLGEHDVSQTNESSYFDVSASTVYRHKRFFWPAVEHDIAVVKLMHPVTRFRPICMPSNDVTPASVGTYGTVTGWGELTFAGRTSDILQKVDLPIVDKGACKAMYKRFYGYNRKFPRGFPDNLFCAAEEQGGKDACQGDSGGPFMVEFDGQISVVGIVSAGQGCGSKTYPGLYTWVLPYMEWLIETVEK